MANYFPCKIYNAHSPYGDDPAYAILSMTKDFSLQDAIEKIQNNPPNNIFILINGQQTMADKLTDDKADDCFGRALCGIDRIAGRKSRKWQGKFKIHTSDSGPDYVSVASTLFDDYGGTDLIIDVVNAKYDWGNSISSNKKTFKSFCTTLQQLLNCIEERASLRFLIAGFSRGGMFSLNLAKWLKEEGYGAETIVITIDPVIKPGERKEWVDNWADWKPAVREKNRRWKIGELHAGATQYKFPILKSSGDKHYNVFERDALGIPQLALSLLGSSAIAVPLVGPVATVPIFGPLLPAVPFLLLSYTLGNLGNKIDYPIGAAIKDAIAPSYDLTGIRNTHTDQKYKKLPLSTPYDQFDISTDAHTTMPSKYKDWVLAIIRKHFPVPVIKLNKTSANPGERIEVTFKPTPKDKSTVSVKLGNVQVSLEWSADNVANFMLPVDTEAGDTLIHTTFYGKTTTHRFIVTPFIRSLTKTYLVAGDKNYLQGEFHQGDKVSINGKIIVPNYLHNTLEFVVPKSTSSSLKNVYVLGENACKSNKIEMVVCKRLKLQVECVPERIKYYKPKKIKLKNKDLKRSDILLLNDKVINHKFHSGAKSNTIEFTAQCLVGLNAVRILRKENNHYSLSDPFALISCDLTGNHNTMELHQHNCVWTTKMLSSNKSLICSTIDHPHKNGYDNCYYCLGDSKR